MPSRINKIRFYFEQIEEYWFHGPQKRFAQDAGINETSFSRILRDTIQYPRYEHICKIVIHLEKKLGIKLDPRDVYRGI